MDCLNKYAPQHPPPHQPDSLVVKILWAGMACALRLSDLIVRNRKKGKK